MSNFLKNHQSVLCRSCPIFQQCIGAPVSPQPPQHLFFSVFFCFFFFQILVARGGIYCTLGFAFLQWLVVLITFSCVCWPCLRPSGSLPCPSACPSARLFALWDPATQASLFLPCLRACTHTVLSAGHCSLPSVPHPCRMYRFPANSIWGCSCSELPVLGWQHRPGIPKPLPLTSLELPIVSCGLF